MYGDTTAIRRLAQRMRDQAVDIRAEARALRGRVESTPWTGRAADTVRDVADRRLAGLREAARKHDEAAVALDHHAGEVDRLKELIAAIERRARHLIAAARERLAELGDNLLDGLCTLTPDPVDELVDRFVAPPPGHLDWLHVDLPGLRG